jgi:hypothetical protein
MSLHQNRLHILTTKLRHRGLRRQTDGNQIYIASPNLYGTNGFPNLQPAEFNSISNKYTLMHSGGVTNPFCILF